MRAGKPTWAALWPALWLAALCLLLPAADAAPAALPLPANPAGAEITLEAGPSAEPEAQRRRRRRRRYGGQRAPTAERIKQIQAALAKRGFYSGEPSGKWDNKTAEAMKKFQEASGLRVTGKIGARSLQKLGLGSPIAGKAPPRDTASAESSQSGSGSPP